MSLIKVEAYKCEWCGRLFSNDRHYHESECKYDPKARTCVSCIFSGELVRDYDKREATGVYCPRRNKMFIYPHEKYCPDYKLNPNFESYQKEVTP